jgi:hypothetical protein
MITGALILLAGIVIGVAATLGAVFYLPKKRPAQKEDKYDRYRNEHGLLTRRAAKG